MPRSRPLAIAALAGVALAGLSPLGATPAAAQQPAADSAAPARRPPAAFFTDSTPLEVTVTVNFGRLRRDQMDDAPWRPATLAFTGAGGTADTIPLRVRTRGNWRLKRCHFPPLRLNLNRQARDTPFDGMDRPKLVNVCQDDDDYERYILQEYQLYRVYNALTDHSPRARLLRLTYVDSANGRRIATRWGFLVEEDDSLAARVGGTAIEQKGATAEHLTAYDMVLFNVFQYLIGNTDWSVNQLHNTFLIAAGGGYVPVAYDFDHAGAVNARYAVPNDQLGIRRVRDRLYRGYCAPPDVVAQVVAHFQARKDAVYALYRDPVGSLLPAETVKSTLEYFDAFYRTIGDPRSAKRELVDACLR